MESVRRHGQGIYRSVSVRGLEHKGEITTVDGTGAFVDNDGQESIAIVKVCPSNDQGINRSVSVKRLSYRSWVSSYKSWAVSYSLVSYRSKLYYYVVTGLGWLPV